MVSTANALTPPYLQRYADLRESVGKLSASEICTVSYEQLLAEPAETLRTLAAFLGTRGDAPPFFVGGWWRWWWGGAISVSGD